MQKVHVHEMYRTDKTLILFKVQATDDGTNTRNRETALLAQRHYNITL